MTNINICLIKKIIEYIYLNFSEDKIELYEYLYKRKYNFWIPGMGIKKEVMDNIGGYSTESYTKQVEDYNLWFRFFQKGYRGYNLEEPLYYVREDRNAYKRKSLNRRFNEIRVMAEGCTKLKLPCKYYLMIIKPIIASIVPSKVLMIYHRRKFKLNDNQL